jgi:hypothetical protein
MPRDELTTPAFRVRKRKSVLGFVGYTAEVDVRVEIGEMAISGGERFVELLEPQIVDLDRVAWLLRVQPRELAPDRFGGCRPIGKDGVALPQPLGCAAIDRLCLAIDRRDAKSAWRAIEIGALAQHRLAALVPADRQECVARATRQDLVSGDALLDDRQEIERNAGRERMQRGGGSEGACERSGRDPSLAKYEGGKSWALTTPARRSIVEGAACLNGYSLELDHGRSPNSIIISTYAQACRSCATGAHRLIGRPNQAAARTRPIFGKICRLSRLVNPTSTGDGVRPHRSRRRPPR